MNENCSFIKIEKFYIYFQINVFSFFILLFIAKKLNHSAINVDIKKMHKNCIEKQSREEKKLITLIAMSGIRYWMCSIKGLYKNINNLA